MKRTKLQTAALTGVFVIFAGYAATLIFPFLWTFYNSFKENREFFAVGGIWSFPTQWKFDNYLKIWNDYDLITYFYNSVKLTVLGTAVAVLSSAMAAYIVAKYEFPLRRFLYATAVLVMIIPSVGSIAALYKFMNVTGLFNTHFGIVLLYAGGFGLNFIILHGFFQSISWSYAEAAFVDGAGDWKVFTHIMLPQAKAAIGAVSIINAINIWNDYFAPWMFLSDPKKYTLALGLRQIVLEQAYAADWPKMFAAMIVATVPILIVYALFQETLIENTVTGGLKG